MVLKKRYFIWKVVKENDRFYSHPNTFLAKLEKWKDKIIVKEYPYNQNGWYLGHIEWDDSKVTAAQILEHVDDFSKYDFKVKTVTEVIDLLNQIYPSDTEPYFSVAEDGFSLIDNRLVEEEF